MTMRKLPWTRQPQYAAQIDPMWMGRGLISASPNMRDFIGLRPSLVGTATQKAYEQGTGLAVDSGSYFQLDNPFRPAEYTMFAFSRTSHRATPFKRLIEFDAGGANRILQWYVGDFVYGFIPFDAGGTPYFPDSISTLVIPVNNVSPFVVSAIRGRVDGADLFALGSKTSVSFTGLRGLGATLQIAKDYDEGFLGYAIFGKALSDREINALIGNPWQLFRPQSRPTFVGLSAGSPDATGTGSLSSIGVSQLTGSATGSASASASLSSISISPVTGTATGATVTNATATGSLAAISISASSGSSVGTATALASFAAISLSPATGSATGTTAGNAIGSGALAGISIAPATSAASGSASASSSLSAVSISPVTGTATGTAAGSAIAVAAFAALSINPATGAAYASAVATGSLPVIRIYPVAGTATAGGTVIFSRAPAGSGFHRDSENYIRPKQRNTVRP